MDTTKCSIVKVSQVIQELNFEEDSHGYKRYITKAMTVTRQDISPAEYCLLQRCQLTTTSVGKSFSMLRKLLAKDGNFTADNLNHYIVVHFKSFRQYNEVEGKLRRDIEDGCIFC